MPKKSKRNNTVPSSSETSACTVCTYVNESGLPECAMCGTPLSVSSAAPRDDWACQICTFANSGMAVVCAVCGAAYPKAASAQIKPPPPVNFIVSEKKSSATSSSSSSASVLNTKVSLEVSCDNIVKKISLLCQPCFDDLCLCTRILFGDGWYVFKDKNSNKNIEKSEDLCPLSLSSSSSMYSFVADRDSAHTAEVHKKHSSTRPSSPNCTVISEQTKYFRCDTCKLSWVCESCMLGCHDSHISIPLAALSHVPTWGVCRCFKSGECLHEVDMVQHQDSEDWASGGGDVKQSTGEMNDDDEGWGAGFVDTADDTMLSNIGGGLGVHQDIIDETRLAVERDVYELNQLRMFQASADLFALESNKFSVRLGMNLAVLNLSKEQALAWYLNLDKMLVIQIDFSAYYWDSVIPPTINVVGLADHLGGIIEPCRLSWTLKNRLKNIFMKHHAEVVKRSYEIEDVKSMMDMSSESFLLCLLALQEKKGNIAQATSLLTEQRQAFLTKLSRSHALEFKGTNTNSGGQNLLEHMKQKVFGSSAYEKNCQKLCESHGITSEVAALVLEVEPNLEAAILLLSHPDVKQQFLSMTKRHTPTASVRTENHFGKLLAHHNVLVRMLLFLCERMKLVNKTCLICDEPLEYEGLRPDVCPKPLCVMGYESFELGFSLAQEIKDAPEVTDLLISFLVAAINANRLLFVTPTGVQIKKKDGTVISYLNSRGELDTQRIKASLESLPSIAEMQQLAARYELQEHLNSIDVLLAPLVRWIITSNRAHIRKLQPEEQIKQMGTQHQFVMLSATPEKERKFLDLRDRVEVKKGKGNGSVWAFHGSSTGNWHSILRTGLKNLSNTKYMTAGAAYGPGIYMGLNSSTSAGYCGMVPGWSKSRFGTSFSCMALCEVVDSDKGINKHTGIYVVPDDDIVNTRFLFVTPSGSVDVKTINIPKLA